MKTLENVKKYSDDDQIDIAVEIPKVFSGKNTNQANAALIIKNSQHFSQTNTERDEE